MPRIDRRRTQTRSILSIYRDPREPGHVTAPFAAYNHQHNHPSSSLLDATRPDRLWLCQFCEIRPRPRNSSYRWLRKTGQVKPDANSQAGSDHVASRAALADSAIVPLKR